VENIPSHGLSEERSAVDFESGLKILVAEDNPVNQVVAARLLKKRGHQVTLAKNGLEVLEILERDWVDVILMDLQMPELNGLEATAAIRIREAEIRRGDPSSPGSAYRRNYADFGSNYRSDCQRHAN
jgi:PleD family two-component response regulator